MDNRAKTCFKASRRMVMRHGMSSLDAVQLLPQTSFSHSSVT